MSYRNLIKKEPIGLIDLDNKVKGLLIDEMFSSFLREKRILPTGANETISFISDSLMERLKETVKQYWYDTYESNAECAVTREQFVDIFVARTELVS